MARVLIVLLFVATLLFGLAGAPGGPLPFGSATALAAEAPLKPDSTIRIYLRTGRVVEGRLLEEAGGKVRVMINVSGIEAEATYPRSDILEIEVLESEDHEEKVADAAPKRSDRPAKQRERARDGAARVYLLELEGRFFGEGGLTEPPRETILAPSAIERALEDAIEQNPDAIVVRLDTAAAGGPAGVFVAEYISPIFERLIHDEGHRIVFWIERAVGGAGLLPFVSPEIYFTTDGRMGGLEGIGETDRGDVAVNEKLIGAYLGHAEGFAIMGGYDPELISPMAREEEWLAYRIRGGKPEYITWEPRPEIDGEDWIVLTDDGQGDNADESVFDQNDVLNLSAELAYTLNVAQSPPKDRLDDLVYEMDLGRDYVEIDGKGARIIEDWSERCVGAVEEIRRINEELAERTRGRDAAEAIGRQISLMKQMRGLFAAYEEALDPSGQQRSQIDIQIEGLREQLRSARQEQRRRGR